MVHQPQLSCPGVEQKSPWVAVRAVEGGGTEEGHEGPWKALAATAAHSHGHGGLIVSSRRQHPWPHLPRTLSLRHHIPHSGMNFPQLLFSEKEIFYIRAEVK